MSEKRFAKMIFRLFLHYKAIIYTDNVQKSINSD